MPILYRLFVAVAIAEACSWLGLLAGMYVKYLGDGNEIGVKIFGPVHGALFVAYGIGVLLLARQRKWSFGTIALGLVCSIPPLASVWFERRIAKAERRARQGETAAAPVKVGAAG